MDTSIYSILLFFFLLCSSVLGLGCSSVLASFAFNFVLFFSLLFLLCLGVLGYQWKVLLLFIFFFLLCSSVLGVECSSVLKAFTFNFFHLFSKISSLSGCFRLSMKKFVIYVFCLFSFFTLAPFLIFFSTRITNSNLPSMLLAELPFLF